MTSAFSWQNSISLCPASFHIPKPNLPVTPGVSWLPPFAFQSPIMKRTCFFFFFFSSVQFSSVQFSRSVMSNALWSHESQHTSLSITNSQSSLRLMSIESVMPSSHLILCHPLLLLPPIPPSIRVFSTFFNLSLNLAIRSSWPEPQSAPGLVFADCIELLHLWLQGI